MTLIELYNKRATSALLYGSIINSVGEKSLTLFLVIKKGVTSETHDTM